MLGNCIQKSGSLLTVQSHTFQMNGDSELCFRYVCVSVHVLQSKCPESTVAYYASFMSYGLEQLNPE